MQPLREIRQEERISKKWSRIDHVAILTDETMGQTAAEVLKLERLGRATHTTVELMKTFKGFPVVMLDGKPYELAVKSYMGREGFDKLLDHTDLFGLLTSRKQLQPVTRVPRKFDQPFNPMYAEGDGAGIVFGPSFEARVKEAMSRGGVLTMKQIEDYLAKHPDEATSYTFVRLPFRPEIFAKVTKPGHLAPSDEMYIVMRNHPVSGKPLPNVPEMERVSYVNKHNIQVVETLGGDHTGNGEEAISVNRLSSVKRYRGCATVSPRLLVINPKAANRNEVGHPKADFTIAVSIFREGKLKWSGSYESGETQRSDLELNQESRQTRANPDTDPFFQFRGTGAVPPGNFHLLDGDVVKAFSPGLGRLTMVVKTVKLPKFAQSVR